MESHYSQDSSNNKNALNWIPHNQAPLQNSLSDDEHNENENSSFISEKDNEKSIQSSSWSWKNSGMSLEFWKEEKDQSSKEFELYNTSYTNI